ncbi:hypothetical protein ACHAWO_008221 [Cyclotella atomus]|uniref:Uncharacterized protein n=1 Tax=Cyclotella atomus TaxID=382360 RepID=A0ABD3N2P5_9STRA
MSTLRIGSTNTTLILTATALGAAATSIAITLHGTRRKRKLLPKAQAGMIETLREMAGSRTTRPSTSCTQYELSFEHAHFGSCHWRRSYCTYDPLRFM